MLCSGKISFDNQQQKLNPSPKMQVEEASPSAISVTPWPLSQCTSMRPSAIWWQSVGCKQLPTRLHMRAGKAKLGGERHVEK